MARQKTPGGIAKAINNVMARRTKTPARKVLKKCAAILYQQVNNGQPEAHAQRPLHGGLVLTLQRRGDAYYVLSLTREDTYPSVTEQDIIVDVFNIPYTAIISRDVQYPKGSSQPYHIIKYQWSRGRGRLIRQIAQGFLEPGVGVHQWRPILDKHGINEPEDYNHLSLEQLRQIYSEIMEVSEQWLQTTQPPPEKAPPAPRNG